MRSTPIDQTVLRRLDQRALELEQQIPSQSVAQDDGHEVTDRKDEASAQQFDTVGGAEVERDLAELREIAAARDRLIAGSYGICVDCGSRIDPQRLNAQPAAARCIICQGQAEHRKAMHRFG